MITGLMDFHIHSNFSDGLFSIGEIVRFAKEKNFKIIGISDHFETMKTKSIKRENLFDYLETINNFKNEFNIKPALEIDFSSRTDIENIPFDLLNRFDYLLFEYVQDPLWNGYPFWKLIEIIEKIKIPVGLAHNHIMKNFGDVNMDEFLNVLESHRIFIEINTNDIYSILGEYFFILSEEFFNLIREREIPVSIGSDMHSSLDDMLSLKKGLDFIERNRLEKNLNIFLDMI